jgi:hypothetical protein
MTIWPNAPFLTNLHMATRRLIRRFHEAVTDPWLCYNNLRGGGVIFDLSTQLPDEDAQVLSVLLVRRTPDCGENLSMGE